MYILVEYAPYGDLLEYLRARASPDRVYENRLNESTLIVPSKRLHSFAHDIACGMEFLAIHKV